MTVVIKFKNVFILFMSTVIVLSFGTESVGLNHKRNCRRCDLALRKLISDVKRNMLQEKAVIQKWRKGFWKIDSKRQVSELELSKDSYSRHASDLSNNSSEHVRELGFSKGRSRRDETSVGFWKGKTIG